MKVVAPRSDLCRAFLIVISLLALAVHLEAQERLAGFGPVDSEPRLLGFGDDAGSWLQVSQVDLGTAQAWMSKYDRDDSDVLEADETTGWSNDAMRMYDLDSDGKLPLKELALALARIRLQKVSEAEKASKAQEAAKKAQQEKQQPPQQVVVAAGPPADPLMVARRNSCDALAIQLVGQFDRNSNKQLEANEYRQSGQAFGQFTGGADANNDGVVTHAELTEWLLRRLPSLESARLAAPLRLLDDNHDGQITMVEFAKQWTDRKLTDFRSLDHNDDGVISAIESHAAPVPYGSRGYADDQPHVLNGNATINPTIWINDNLTIEDLDIRVALTKEADSQIKLYLTGPDGQQVTLFAGGWVPWTGSYIFESTLIDDEAPPIKETLPKAPLPRRLRTDALRIGEPSLRHFYGKSSRGSWQLRIANVDGNVGVLHHWSLWVKPAHR